MSRILFRLSIAWLAIVGVFSVLGVVNSTPDTGLTFVVYGLPGALGLILAWVFLPAKR